MKLKHIALATVAAASALAAQASSVTVAQKTGSFQSGLADANAYKAAVDAALVGVTPVAIPSFTGYFATSMNTLKYDIDFGISAAQTGSYTFEFGLDLGGGGAVFLDGVAMAFNPNDMWWRDNGLSFQFTQTMAAGNHTIEIYGFEGCCYGDNFGQFRVGSGQTVTFGNNDGLAPVPEPESLAMMLAGLSALALSARRRKI